MPELQEILNELNHKNQEKLQTREEIIKFLEEKRDELSGEEIFDTEKANERCNVINTINFALKQLEEPEEEKGREENQPDHQPKMQFIESEIEVDFSSFEIEEPLEIKPEDIVVPADLIPFMKDPKNGTYFQDYHEDDIKRIYRDYIYPPQDDGFETEFGNQRGNHPDINYNFGKELEKYERSKDPDYDKHRKEVLDALYKERRETQKRLQELEKEIKEEKQEPEPQKPEPDPNPESPDYLNKVREAFGKYDMLKCYSSIQEFEINFCLPENELSRAILPKPKTPFSKDFC